MEEKNTKSNAQKIAVFNNIYDRCLEHFENVKKDGNDFTEGYGSDDDKLVFEFVMKQVLGENIFEEYNKYCDCNGCTIDELNPE